MRNGTVSMLALTLCVAACGKAAEPEAPPSEGPAVEASAPAPAPLRSAHPTPETAVAASPVAKAPDPIVARELRALGTEPFWNARIAGATLTYTTPEDQKGKTIPIERRDTGIGAVFSGTLDGAPLVLTVTKRTCSDGMSDRDYPFSTVLTIGSQRRVGCAV